MGLTALQQHFSEQILSERIETNKVYDAVIGIVTDNKDPDKLARVKVKLPAINEQETSRWAPLVMLGASKNRGWFFIPEVEDEVLIIHEHGDPNRPVVIGALWNGKDKVPDKLKAEDQKRQITSREGSKVIFDDKDDKIVIEDGTKKGRITLDAKKKKIIIEALEGDVCFQAPEGELKIVAKEAEFKAGKNLAIEFGKGFKVGGKQKIDIKGTCCVKITAEICNQNSGGCAPEACDADPQDVNDSYTAPASNTGATAGPSSSGVSSGHVGTGSTGGGC
jgi:phage baseplate assembly protein gpV